MEDAAGRPGRAPLGARLAPGHRRAGLPRLARAPALRAARDAGRLVAGRRLLRLSVTNGRVHARRLPLLAVACLARRGCGGDDENEGGSTAPERAVRLDGGSHDALSAVGRRRRARDGPGGARTRRRSETTAPCPARASDRPQGAPDAAACAGTYVSSSFSGQRSFDSPFGAVDALRARPRAGPQFDGARWTFRGVGASPMRGTALGIKGTLKVNGSARGRLCRTRGERRPVPPDRLARDGHARRPGPEFELPVSVVAAAVVPDGPAKVRCGGGRLAIDSALRRACA